MSSGTASMMLPSALCSASACNSLNTPEEDDETMSNKVDCEPGRPGASSRPGARHSRPPGALSSSRPGALTSSSRPGAPDPNDRPRPRPCTDRLLSVDPEDSVAYGGGHGGGGAGYLPYQPPHGLPAGYSQPTPFPSQEGEPSSSSWLHPPSLASGWTTCSGGGGFPTSLPSYPSPKDPWPSYSPGDDPSPKDPWPSYSPGDDSPPPSSSSSSRFGSLPGRYSPAPGSLEQPHSLRSNPPPPSSTTSAYNVRHHTMSPYHCSPPGGACCAQCPADVFNRAPMMAAAAAAATGHHHPPTYGHYYADSHRLPGAGYGLSGHYGSSKQNNPAYNSPLSLEQRRVFVTYEADDDRHVNEIINFVALLRHNGFDTHIDMFEQHFRSISKIDFMERYLSEKEYLIIIIISPKYHETVTAPPVSLEGDERTLNTVYIHKRLQNEFIQNGSKNFRFIPILFPGARKSHVPNWLQNTQVYGWPRDRDDILRRLMRVEKYNPPPIGQLPTIIPIPI